MWLAGLVFLAGLLPGVGWSDLFSLDSLLDWGDDGTGRFLGLVNFVVLGIIGLDSGDGWLAVVAGLVEVAGRVESAGE